MTFWKTSLNGNGKLALIAIAIPAVLAYAGWTSQQISDQDARVRALERGLTRVETLLREISRSQGANHAETLRRIERLEDHAIQPRSAASPRTRVSQSADSLMTGSISGEAGSRSPSSVASNSRRQ